LFFLLYCASAAPRVCLEPLASHIPGDDRQAAVDGVRDDLEEVAAHFTRGPVVALHHQPWKYRPRLGQDDLLHLLGLLQIGRHLPLSFNRLQQAAQQWCDGRRDEEDSDVAWLPLHLDGFLAESDAAWPLHFPKQTPRGLSVFDFGAAFSIPDKRSCGMKVLEGAYLSLRNPENPRN
jgi:hypothetical protein